jgi:hypothetical protein
MLVDSIVVRGIFLFYGNKCKRSIAKRNKYKQKEEIMGHPTSINQNCISFNKHYHQ